MCIQVLQDIDAFLDRLRNADVLQVWSMLAGGQAAWSWAWGAWHGMDRGHGEQDCPAPALGKQGSHGCPGSCRPKDSCPPARLAG